MSDQTEEQWLEASQPSLALLNEAETALWSAVEPLRREVRRQEGEASTDYEERALTHLEAVDQALARCGDALEELLGFHHHFMSRISGAAVSRRVQAASGRNAVVPGDMAAACKPCGGSGRFHRPNIGWEACPICHGSGLSDGS